MELTLPTKPVRVLGTNWTFSMNPGPFNVKEHALVTLFANSGLDPPLALQIVSMAKVLFKMNISIWAALTLTLATQMLGYGFAGVFMNFLVNSPYMWWPYCLIDVSFYRALHDVELRPKGHLTKFQFFVIVSVASFSYYIVPNYFFPSISSLAFICWIWKDSVVAQIIGSGRYGLGIGSFGVDWVTISVPIAYWSNLYHARCFPFSSYNLYDFDGQVYNVSRILNENDHSTNESGYNNYSKVYMSTVHLFSFGFKFAALSATCFVNCSLRDRDAWLQFKESYKRKNDNFGGVHNRLMRRYNPIPKWWFYAILVFTISIAAANSEGFGKQLQLPFWGVLLGCLLAFILLLPVGVIEATTGQVNNN
ncbi:hypothetical protein IFM89_037462 [Coptis chinensis]|uniref:Uncharacterized protein n=1 Tax=Coptis chinensis TaxID=261450 RepID=A0A835LUD5_9MAGN|nr:hypothetical protein IFM89_037462 [Coptis chinensis]